MSTPDQPLRGYILTSDQVSLIKFVSSQSQTEEKRLRSCLFFAIHNECYLNPNLFIASPIFLHLGHVYL